MMTDRPAYAADRFARCLRKFVQHRAMEIREPQSAMTRALVRYWEKEARKVRHGA